MRLPLRMTLWAALSVGLMVADARFAFLHPVRGAASLALRPLEQVASAPLAVSEAVDQYLVGWSRLERDNRRLQAHERQLMQAVATQQALQTENANLRRLIDARARVAPTPISAEIIYSSQDPFSRKVTIDKGSRQGVVDGQAVMDAVGVVGQITRTGALSAEVTLLTDKSEAVPVQVVRNGLRAVVFGLGRDDVLNVPYQAPSADVNKGDVLVTSGVDGIYPQGLPVATVTAVERNPAEPFARIQARPLAGVQYHRQVLVLLNKEKPLPRVEPPPAPAPVRKKGHKK